MAVRYKDYYKVLGVPKDASAADIRRAYRKLAREHHPDVSRSGDAGARFKEINEANEVLSDPEKRRRYDAVGANWQQYEQWQQGMGGRGFDMGPLGFRFGGGIRFGNGGPEDMDLGGFSDFFRMFFSDLAGGATTAQGRATRARAVAGPDLEQAVEITLVEAYRGTERALELRGPDVEPRRITAKIPAGVRDGQRIRLAGQGAPGRAGGRPGDLYLRVRVREHPFFRRDGDDIRAELPVSLGEALLGAEVPVPTLKGRLRLRIPPETQNGRVIRLAGQGMPRLEGAGLGDMYVTVRVVLPQKLTDEERELVTRLMAGHPDDVRGHLL